MYLISDAFQVLNVFIFNIIYLRNGTQVIMQNLCIFHINTMHSAQRSFCTILWFCPCFHCDPSHGAMCGNFHLQLCAVLKSSEENVNFQSSRLEQLGLSFNTVGEQSFQLEHQLITSLWKAF